VSPGGRALSSADGPIARTDQSEARTVLTFWQ
jgi:hypothetical protein